MEANGENNTNHNKWFYECMFCGYGVDDDDDNEFIQFSLKPDLAICRTCYAHGKHEGLPRELQAAISLELALEMGPKNRGRYLDLLIHSVSLHPTSKALSELAKYVDDPQRATAAMLQAHKLDPSNPLAIIMLPEVLAAANRFDEAFQFNELNPIPGEMKIEQVFIRAQLLYCMGKASEAVVDLAKSLNDSDELMKASRRDRWEQMVNQYGAGENPFAVKFYERLKHLEPGSNI
ncbi:MAG: hypothetical protein IT444_10930 [Phycisphaeraceae bacterium]|nr:hypothetical protein [Phycisphaeraceae bacterium]